LVGKDVFRGRWDDFVSRAVDPQKCQIFSTSGSTGTPTKLLKNKATVDMEYAMVYYAFFECGMSFSDRFLDLSINFPNVRKCVFRHGPAGLMKGVFLQLKLQDPIEIVNQILKIKPTIIYTFPSILEIMIEDFGDKLSTINPKLVFTQAEELTDRQKRLIEDCWGIKPNETYGSREFARLAFECNDHSGLHVLNDQILLEIVKDGKVVSSNEQGETIVTSLYNFGMPLIRYRLGDLARWSDDECSCGRSWPLLKAIEGRVTAIITLPSGRRIYGNILGSIIRSGENAKFIKRYQIVFQQSKAHFIVKLICYENMTEKEKTLLEQNVSRLLRRSCFNEDISVEVCFVSSIPPLPSGKNPSFILET
jgi:phenylacetate-CoA ligase